MTPRKAPTNKKRRAARRATDARRPLVRAALAVSLDGYIADVDGGAAWLNPYFSPEMDFGGFMKSIGATVMGRKTFGAAMALGGGGPMDGGIEVVLSRRPIENLPKGIEAFRGDLRALVDRLRRELDASGKDIWLMGGGEAIDAFRAARLVDRLELGIIPVLLGDGIPLFPRHARGLEGFQQTHCRALANGVVEIWYEPNR